MGLSPFLVAVALAVSPAESGISALADRIAEAIDARFVGPPGNIVAVNGNFVGVDLGEVPPGTRLERLTKIGPLLDPRSLVPLGILQQSCGQVVVGRHDGSISLGKYEGDANCPRPEPGDRVEWPQGPFTILVGAAEADAAVAELVQLLAAILPERLRATGRFLPVPAVIMLDSTAPQDLAQLNLDAAVRLRAARSDARLHILIDIDARVPRVFRDVAQIDAPLVPEMLWRRPARGMSSPFGIGSVAVDGEILALAVRQLDDRAELLALTQRALLRLRWDGGPRFEVEIDFQALPPARSKTRIAAGSLVTQENGQTCFATTTLADGWCQTTTALSAIPGVPIEGPDGRLLLAQFVPGTNLLDGKLRSSNGGETADIGPFLRATRPYGGGLLVYRNDARLERWTNDLRRSSVVRARLGDAWFVMTDGSRIESSPADPSAPDAFLTIHADGKELKDPVSGAIVAITALDVDGDGRTEIAVATSVQHGPSRLTLFAQPDG